GYVSRAEAEAEAAKATELLRRVRSGELELPEGMGIATYLFMGGITPEEYRQIQELNEIPRRWFDPPRRDPARRIRMETAERMGAMIDDGKRPVRNTPEPVKGREPLLIHQRDKAFRLIQRLAVIDAFALREQPKGPGWMELVELVTDANDFL